MIETLITVSVIILDQLTKYWAKYILAGNVLEVIPGIIEFRYLENTGMAFGLLSNATWLLAVFSVVMSAAIIFVIVKYRKASGKLFSYSLAMILGGAVGNAIDRVFFGFVTDFIDPVFIEFAVFNTADSFICVGTALLIIYMLFFDAKYTAVKAESDGNDADNRE